MAKNQPNQTDLIEQGVQDFMWAVHRAAAESLQSSVTAIEAMSRATVMMQKMACQQVLLSSLLKQREQLTKLMERADAGMERLLESQLRTFDGEITATLEAAGVPQEAAQAALLTYQPRVVGKTGAAKVG